MFAGVLNTPQITVRFYRYYQPETDGEFFGFFTRVPEKYLSYIFVIYRKVFGCN